MDVIQCAIFELSHLKHTKNIDYIIDSFMSQYQTQTILLPQKHLDNKYPTLLNQQIGGDRVQDFASKLQKGQCVYRPKQISCFSPSDKLYFPVSKSDPSSPVPNFHPKVQELMVACQKLQLAEVQEIIQTETLDHHLFSTRTKSPFFYAMQNPSEDEACKIINLLANRFPDLVNSKDSKGSTSLNWALEHLSSKFFKHLLLNKADPNFQLENSRNTILHELVLKSEGYHSEPHFEIAQMLLEHDADPLIKNREGKNCLQLSKFKGFGLEEEIEGDFQFQSTQQKEDSSFSRGQISNVSFLSDEFSDSFSDESNKEQFEQNKEALCQNLTEEIVYFEQECTKKYQSAWKSLRKIYEGNLTQIAKALNLEIHIIGSFATGLWVETSDINIMYTTSRYTDHDFIPKTLSQIQKMLRFHKRVPYRKLYIKKNSKFQKLKIQLPQEQGGWKLDISVFHRNTSGSKYVKYINDSLKYYPNLKALFFVLHEILTHFQVDSMEKGGLQNYFLFLMIGTALSQISDLQQKSLGMVLLEVLKTFAKGIPFENLEQEQPFTDYYSIFDIQDPLNEENSIRKRTNVQKVEEVFKALSHGAEFIPKTKIINYFCSLKKIFL